MSDTESKIVLSGIDIQEPFCDFGVRRNMVRKFLDKGTLPLFKLSDMHEKVGVPFPPHCLIGFMGPAKSHTVKNRIEEL